MQRSHHTLGLPPPVRSHSLLEYFSSPAMQWTTSNDPWSQNSKHKSIKVEQFNKGFKHGMRNCEPFSPPFDNMDIDMKAVYIAQQLMLANVNQNRQCAAASTSALSHLAYHGGAKEVRHNVGADEMLAGEVKALVTNIEKPEFSTHMCAGEPHDGGRHDDHASEPLNTFEQILPIQASDATQAGEAHVNKYKVEDKDCDYAFTHSEMCKMDTGEDYIKLPLSSYVKVIEHKGDKMKVERIGGCFSASSKAGWIPIEKVTLTPARFVPVHLQIAERVCNKYVSLDESLDNFPLVSAGPNSRSIRTEDTIFVKDLDAENANVTVLDVHGKHSGFGKIPTTCLLGAQVVPKPLDAT